MPPPQLPSLVGDYGVQGARRRRSILNSSCAVTALLAFPAALFVGIMLAGPVQAATTINSNKSSTVDLGNTGNYAGGNPFTITSGTTISTSSGDGVYGSNSAAWTLTNAGTVQSSAATGIYFWNGGSVTNTGSVSGADTSGHYGIEINALNSTFSNGYLVNSGDVTGYTGAGLRHGGTLTNSLDGTITGTEAGVYTGNALGYVNNSGSIGGTTYGVNVADGGTVSNTGGTITGYDGIHLESNLTIGSVFNTGSVHGSNVGVQLSGGGYISNSSAGSITGNNLGIYTDDGAGTIHNDGYIHGTNDGMHLNAGGIVNNTSLGVISGTDDGIQVFNSTGTVTNDGSIGGTTYGVYLKDGGAVTNQASGMITGATGVYLGAPGSVDNAGTITGTSGSGIYLSDGGTVTNESGGVITGTTYGLLSSNLAAASVNNAGTILGGTVLGGYGVALNYTGESLTNSGSINGYVGAYVYGGTIKNTAGTISGSLLGVQFGTLAGSYLKVTGGLITGTGTIGVGADLRGSGSIYNAGTISGTLYGVELQDGGSIGNYGSILGGIGGVSIDSAAGTLNNGSGSTVGYISGAIYGVLVTAAGGTVINAGTIIANNTNSLSAYGVEMTYGGNVTNSAGGSIVAMTDGVYLYGGAGTVKNSGVIDTFGTAGAAGILLTGGGYVLNSGTAATIFGGSIGVALESASGYVRNESSIGGGTFGVYIGTGGTLNNSGLMTGGTDGVFLASSNTSFVNSGSIIGSAGTGAYLQSGGNVTNSAGGYIAGALRGVYIVSGGGTVINAGTIRNGTGTVAPDVVPDFLPIGYDAGVLINGGGVVTNSAGGYIQGDALGVGIYGSLLTSAYVTNAASATINGGSIGVDLDAASNTLLNGGTVSGGDIGAGLYEGSVTNASGGTISGGEFGVYLAGFGTVDNSGTITQSGTFHWYAGILLNDGGYVINRAGGTIIGTSNGIYNTGASALTVANYGTIGATQGDYPSTGILLSNAAGTITNHTGGVIYSNGSAAIGAYNGNLTINNDGTIRGDYYGIHQEAGDYGGMTVTNSGIIESNDDAIFGWTGSVTNDGTIESADENGVNLLLGSVYNAGTISGGVDGVYIAGDGDGNATIQNQFGTITGNGWSGVQLATGGNVYNSGSAAITGKYNGIYVNSGTATVDSYGQITGTLSAGVQLRGGGLVNNLYNTFLGVGTISGKYDGIFTEGAAATVNNEGLIYASKFNGVYLAAGGTVSNLYNTFSAGRIIGNYNGVEIGSFENPSVGTVLNHGTITGSFGNGVVLYGLGAVINYAEGTIFGGHAGVNVYGVNATLVNDGTIQAGYFGSGVRLAYGARASNFGTIDGGGRGAGVYISNGGSLSNASTGKIYGEYGVRAINGGPGISNSVYNIGYIGGTKTGAVLYTGTVVNAGNDIYSGTIYGGQTGVDIAFYGRVLNGGTIIGDDGAGLSFDNGGYVNNYASGGGIGVITGGSIGIANASDDRVTILNSGTVSGGVFGVSVNGTGYVQNRGLISGTEGEGVYMRYGYVLNLSTGTITSNDTGVEMWSQFASVENAGLIDGTNFAGVYFGYGGHVTNLAGGTISGGSYGVVAGYESNTASNIGTVVNAGAIYGGTFGVALRGLGTGSGSGVAVNSGSIGGGDVGVYLANGGTVINQRYGFVNGFYGIHALGGPATLMNAGAIVGEVAVDFQHGGTVANQSYGTIFGYIGVGISNGAALVTNAPSSEIFGILDGVTIGYSGESIATPGTVVNGGYIIGFEYGVSMFDPGTVINDGEIGQVYSSLSVGAAISMNNGGLIDNEAGGTIIGATGVTFANIAGTLINAGTITGSYQTGVVLSHGGYLYNSGTIAGAIGGLGVGYNADRGANTGTVENSGLISGGTYGLWLHDGGILGNEAAGTISGTATGVEAGAVARVTNAGLITASTGTALDMGGGGFVDNSGTIAGYGYGLLAGAPVSLTNTGLLTASAGAAADLAGGGTVTNTGSIGGNTDGLDTGGAAVVVNAGRISGAAGVGVALGGGTLSNDAGGTISGGTDGVTAGSGASIVNAGLITDSPALSHAGVVLSGDAALTNLAAGTISGTTGVLIEGNDTSLLDLGTIIGTGGQAITVAPNVDPAQITLTTGSSLTGDIDGGGTDGQITLTGHNTIGNTITDFGAGSGLTVANGAIWTATGDWTVATVTNDGIFQPGVLGTPLKLTGNFVQAPGATLQVVVTPTLSSQFIVTGTATLAGNLSYEFAPGTYSPHTYDFLTADGGQKGGFSATDYTGSVPLFLTHGTALVTDAAHLNLDQVIYPGDDSLLGDAAQASAQAAQQAGDGLLDHAASGGGGTSAAACAAEAGVMPSATAPYGTSTASRLASAIGNAFCGAGGWIEATGAAMTLDGSGQAAGYTADAGGFMAGLDHAVNQSGTRVGLAIGYDEDWLNDSAGGKATVDTTRLGIYAAQPLGRFTLAGDFMLGLANDTTTRPTGVGNAKASYGSTDYAGGVQAQTQYDYRGVSIRPAAGLRIASVTDGGFVENGGGYVPEFAVSGAGSSETSVQPYAKVDVSKGFYTPSMTLITPSLSVGYDYEAGDTGRRVSITAQDGTHFDTFRTSLGRNTAELGAGVSAGKGNWSLFAKYSAYLSGNWTSQIGEAGFTMKF